MGGTILRMIDQGWKVGILDLTSGEPTPLGDPVRRASETAAANAAIGNPWRENLGLANRSLEATLINRRAAGRCLSPGPAPAPLRPLLGRCSPRPHRGDQAGRGCSILEQALQDRHSRHASPSRARPLLLQRAFADHRAAEPSDRHLRSGRGEADRAGLLSLTACRQPAARAADGDRLGLRSHAILGTPRRGRSCRAVRQPRASCRSRALAMFFSDLTRILRLKDEIFVRRTLQFHDMDRQPFRL